MHGQETPQPQITDNPRQREEETQNTYNHTAVSKAPPLRSEPQKDTKAK